MSQRSGDGGQSPEGPLKFSLVQSFFVFARRFAIPSNLCDVFFLNRGGDTMNAEWVFLESKFAERILARAKDHHLKGRIVQPTDFSETSYVHSTGGRGCCLDSPTIHSSHW